MLSVREPARSASTHSQPVATFSLRQIVEFLWHRRAFYGAFYGGMSAHTIALFAYQAWLPAFFARTYGRPLSRIGLEYGTLVLVMGCLGVLSGPVLGQWLRRRGRADYALRVPAIGALSLAPFVLMLPFSGTYLVALWISAAITFFCTLPLPMAASALQLVTPNRIRGVASAIYIFAVSIIGVTIPPTLIALLTDHVFHDPARIGWSLTIAGFSSTLVAATILFRGLGAYRQAIAQSE
jgi:MFS family permease